MHCIYLGSVLACVYLCTCHSTSVEVSSQLVGVSFPSNMCIPGIELRYQLWSQASLPCEPSHEPKVSMYSNRE